MKEFGKNKLAFYVEKCNEQRSFVTQRSTPLFVILYFNCVYARIHLLHSFKINTLYINSLFLLLLFFLFINLLCIQTNERFDSQKTITRIQEWHDSINSG